MTREYPKLPLIGVGVIVLGVDNILLIRRGKPPRQGSWSLPGGAQKLGETVYDAAVREVREETGIRIETIGLVDVVDSIHLDQIGAVQYHYTLIDVLARPLGGVLTAGGDAIEVEWAAIDDISGMELWSETERVIHLALEMLELIPE